MILTLYEWNKLQTAKSQVEFEENAGDCFTLKELSELTELSSRTISEVLGCIEPVDRYSLQAVFQCFGLEMSKNDYIRPTSRSETSESQESQQINLWSKWNWHFIEDGSMTDLRLRNENFSEHFEVTTQANSPSDSPINHALIAMAQEVAELLKQAYLVQVGQIDRVELIDGKRSPQ